MTTEILIQPFAIRKINGPNIGLLLWTIDVRIGGGIAYSSRRIVGESKEELEPIADDLRSRAQILNFSQDLNWIPSRPALYEFEVCRGIGVTPSDASLEQIGPLVGFVIAKGKNGKTVYQSNSYSAKDDPDLYLMAAACTARREQCSAPDYWKNV